MQEVNTTFGPWLDENPSEIHEEGLLLRSISLKRDLFFFPIMVIGIIGNGMILIVIFKAKDMLNSTNIYLANLAIADILVLLVAGTLSSQILAVKLAELVSYSERYFDMVYFTMDTVINASVLTALAIGFERYYAVCQPLKARYIFTKKRAFKICLLAWAFAALSCSPELLIDPQENMDLRDWHIIFNTSVFFFLAATVLIVIFSKIAWHLRNAVAPSVDSAKIRHRGRVVTMLGLVILCFFIFQLPYRVHKFVSAVWGYQFNEWLGAFGLFTFVLTSRMMISLHSVVNPILYNLMSKRFRAGFQSLCCGLNPFRRRCSFSKQTGELSSNS